MGAYLHALATGDVAAIVAAFEPEGYLRDAEARQHSREGPDGLTAYYQRLFSTGGGIPLESCALVDDGRNCVLEYNVVGWGATRLPPRAGAGVFVRGHGGRLAAVRLYDDTIPPLGRDA
jgi:hypothetical protein